MTRDKLGIGFVGAGFITSEFHAPSLRHIPHAEAAGVMNPTLGKAKQVAESLQEMGCGEPFATSDLKELVADPRVDAVG